MTPNTWAGTDVINSLNACKARALGFLPNVHKAITEFMSDLGKDVVLREKRQGDVPAEAMKIINANDPEQARKFIESFV